jgi:hypothetical protein
MSTAEPNTATPSEGAAPTKKRVSVLDDTSEACLPPSTAEVYFEATIYKKSRGRSMIKNMVVSVLSSFGYDHNTWAERKFVVKKDGILEYYDGDKCRGSIVLEGAKFVVPGNQDNGDWAVVEEGGSQPNVSCVRKLEWNDGADGIAMGHANKDTIKHFEDMVQDAINGTYK